MFLENIRRVFVVEDIIDFRKFFNGLLDEAYKRGFNPYAGDGLVFINRNATQIRLLLGDSLGLFVLARRFDGRALGRKRLLAGLRDKITVAELAMLFEGTAFRVEKKATGWEPDNSLIAASRESFSSGKEELF
jgi:hypothetical protein